MRIRARAASLCAAVLFVIVLLPAAAQAAPTQDGITWPGNLAHTNFPGPGPEIISPGPCPAAGETATFTFAYEEQGVIMGADGRFEARGSFTIIGTEDDADLVSLESTYSGSSPNGTIEGRHEMRRGDVWGSFPGGATCEVTPDGNRQLSASVQRLYAEHRLTSASTGDVTFERGYAFVLVSSWAVHNTGSYVSRFIFDEDVDLVEGVDNCPQLYNPWQNDMDGDGLGDDCDPDVDGDSFLNMPDNCTYVPNPDQADEDGDDIGDVCDWENNARDSDGDGVSDLVDNCVDVPNPDQADADGDRLGTACDPDDCPSNASPLQRDSDGDGRPDFCDETFDSTDGFAGGGGKTAGKVHLSVALHSSGGTFHGSGQLADGATTVRLLDVTGLRSDGNRVVAVGNARVDQGDPARYRLEIADAANTFELEVGDRRWQGTLANGNLVVK